MTTLTHTQIANAKNNELDAVSAVIRETEDLVIGRARRFATTGGYTDSDLMEDLAQVGRIAVWEAISAFAGDDPAHFVAHADRSIKRAMEDTRREVTRPGVSVFTAKRFEAAISLAGGDPYEAERIAASEDRGDEKLTPELARAARLSWMGLDSLDRPFNVAITGKHITLGDVIAKEMEGPSDLVDSRDIAAHRRRVIGDQVHRALGHLSDRQRHVVKAAHGITPVPLYRAGEDDAELAADMDVTPYQVQQARTKGQRRFAELYRAGARAW
ncbi:sigma factor [Streptomyces sp. NPDC047315]|uniref:sigma factor n=1 Tax=Streptomyces sp. NPDC047315 TaxID=3155142 RepID=UPI0034010F1E